MPASASFWIEGALVEKLHAAAPESPAPAERPEDPHEVFELYLSAIEHAVRCSEERARSLMHDHHAGESVVRPDWPMSV